MSCPELRRVRGLAWAGVVGCVFFLLTAGLLQVTRSDLDPWQHTLSFYLHGPGSLWLCLAYLLLGVAMAAGGRLLCRLAPASSPAGQTVMACLAVAGVGLVCVAAGDRLFPPDQLSRPGLFHHFTAYCAFAAVLLALPVQALRFAAHPGWRRWAWTATLGTLLCWSLAWLHVAGVAWLPRGGGQKLLITLLVSLLLVALLGLLHRLAAKRDNSRDNAGTTFSAMEPGAMIERFDCGPRLAEMTVHNGVAYLAGQVPEDTSADITGQTAQVLAEIDALLARAGTSKQHILRAEIFLADINDAPGMNVAWDAWVPAGHAPARATAEAKLVNKDWKVEIIITAAIP